MAKTNTEQPPPGVATRPRDVLPVFFQVVEKGKHKIGVEIVKGNLVYGFLPRTSYELEQKAEGVADDSDGVWAGLFLRTQVFKKGWAGKLPQEAPLVNYIKSR